MQFPSAGQSRRFTSQTAQMQGDVVLLKVMVGAREGWSVMALDEFMRKLNLEVWRTDERLVGTILPKRRTLN